MKRLIIADVQSMNNNGRSIGHYFTVAANYNEIFSKDYDVFIAGGPVYYSNYKHMVKLKYDTYSLASLLINKLKIIKNCFDLFSQVSNAIIIFQCSSIATAYLGIALCPCNINVYMIQYNTLGINSKLKRFLFKLAKGNIAGTICPSEKIGEAYGLPYCVVPDYILTQNRFKSIHFTNDHVDYDFGVFGIITWSKGVIEVAAYFAHTNYRLIIAGHPSDNDIKEELINICADSPNITVIFDYLTTRKYNSYIKGSKYCILNYTEDYSQHSSGVVFDILFNGKPVLGRKCKFLSFITENHIGVVYRKLDELPLDELLREDIYHLYLENIKKYLENHRNYEQTLIDFIGSSNKRS
ncbi:hypothetical protein [Clostridium kluyveri]|uniref:hypothetical protein n=1 Tax=Clostridium kluyveri TaxID=1534 RepID=UPI0022484B1E|nr:hypothetical protein [Clostridium kluyveri]UZQ50357.1 hypothetical protein OP486_20880 [Clostridium kluyveri]